MSHGYPEFTFSETVNLEKTFKELQSFRLSVSIVSRIKRISCDLNHSEIIKKKNRQEYLT